MVSTRRLSQAEQVAPNARLWAGGGFICADVRNAVTSAAATVHQVSMLQSTTPLRVIRSSPASSRASTGFTIIAPRNPSPARSFLLPSAIRSISRRRDRPERCLRTGRRSFTNRGAFRSGRESAEARICSRRECRFSGVTRRPSWRRSRKCHGRPNRCAVLLQSRLA